MNRVVRISFSSKACLLFLCIALFVVSPLFPEQVLTTQAHDLANHVRHIFEYKLALQEGQFPPLVAPRLNDNLRIPLFQFYSGTGYTIPGLISLLGASEYLALKITILMASFLAAVALFDALLIILGNQRAALAGALSFQLFAFGFIGFYNRGGYPEWLAMQYMVLCFWSAIKLVNVSRSKLKLFPVLIYFSAAITTFSLFIPCHPVHTLYTGMILGILIITYALETEARWRSLTLPFLAFIISIGISAWYWLPLILYHSELRVTGHSTFLSADTSLDMVLYPWFRPSERIPGWAPQLGVHITVFWLILMGFIGRLPWKKTPPLAQMSAVLLLVLVIVIILPSLPISMAWLNALKQFFSLAQWSYRFFVPTALVSALVVGYAWTYLYRQIHSDKIESFILKSFIIFLIVYTVPFVFLSKASNTSYQETLDEIRSPNFRAPNSSFYAFYGTDYASLGWLRENQLVVNKPLLLPHDAIPFEVELTLANEDLRNTIDVAVTGYSATHHYRQHRDAETNLPVLEIGIKDLVIGLEQVALQPTILFQSAQPIPIKTARYRPLQDMNWLKLPTQFEYLNRSQSEVSTFLVVADEAGLYQLPINYFPSIEIWVNGHRVKHASNDRFLIVVPLQRGQNAIKVKAYPNLFAACLFWVSILSITVFAGFVMKSPSRLRPIIGG